MTDGGVVTVGARNDRAAPAVEPGTHDGVPGAHLLARLGHELRSPLSGILGLTRIMLAGLADGSVDPRQHARQLELMRASASELLDTVDRIVALARLDLEPPPASRAFDCRRTVDEVTGAAQAAARGRGRRLCAEPTSEPLTITSDEVALQQILAELVDNAVKYSEGGEVVVRCWRPTGGDPVVEVCDGGPGMSVEEQVRILAPFERGAAAERHSIAGSGLGLHLAHRLAARIGAELTMRSSPAAGTTVSIRIEE